MGICYRGAIMGWVQAKATGEGGVPLLLYLPCFFYLIYNQDYSTLLNWKALLVCYGHIITNAAPLIRTGNLNVIELHQYWVE